MLWNESCCVCRWPIYFDMQTEYGDQSNVFAVGHEETEAHPWCAPFRQLEGAR